ncbi:MAG: hypothetical protein QOG74_509 [Alphaproteobacteria bacterium]|nr:hypothetical protein [Alphaproteobacteria bacterium]
MLRAARRALTRASTSRAGRCVSLAALALLLGNESLQNAVAEGDTRTISLHHVHTGEDLTITYKRDGRYDEAALKKLNWLLRDWRRSEDTRMDPRLIDVVWEVSREFNAQSPIQVICGYRAPQTNSMLRRRSRGVAQFSQHTLGRAMDFYIPGVSLEAQREAGLRLQRGGVGYYPSSGSPFVHLDVGSVRHWPRMSHDQLARVFPNGRTVHVPSDGQPLSGYALALADIQKRGSEPSEMSLEAARAAGINVGARPQRNLLASLFGAKDDEDDSEPAAASTKASSGAEPKPDKTAEPKVAKPVPTPRPAVRVAQVAAASAPAPATTFRLASAESRPAPLSEAPAPSSANDVISHRGYWDAPTGVAPPPKERVQLASTASAPAPAPRPRGEQRPPAETTGAIGFWPVRTADAADRVPQDLALAFAAQADVALPAPLARGVPAANAIPRSAATIEQSGAATIARKNLPAATLAAAADIEPGMVVEDPWLRALVLAPDLQNYMTATLLGEADPLALRPLMQKPDAVVMMTFSDDPHLGMTADRFSGEAVVFISTMSVAKRTAALR